MIQPAASGLPGSASKPPTSLLSVPVTTEPGGASVPKAALLYGRFAYFMSELRDEKGDELIVAEHHEEWADLFQGCPLLCLLAPRDHGKTTTAMAYLLWRVWSHNRDPLTGELLEDLPDGRFQAVLFSDTLDQAKEFFGKFQSLLLANEELFGDIAPSYRRRMGKTRDVWSSRRAQLRNLAEVVTRAFATSTRGLHPDLVLCDDVLNEKNSLTSYQRNKRWTYFVGTLLPMNAAQYILIGTALHYDDLLHRLKPDPTKAPMVVKGRLVRFRWVKYRAVNWDTGACLWPEQHSLEDLRGRQAIDVVIFAREYQNDPRDESSSMFPFSVTAKALAAGKDLIFVPTYRRAADEWVVGSADFAMSEKIGADYCVVEVAAVNRLTLKRTILMAWRERGWSFEQQVGILVTACRQYNVDLLMMEQNSFQKWVLDETKKHPETAGRVVGHQTGGEKSSLVDGVPSLKMTLDGELWVMPSGDEQSRAFGQTWQSELNAFGWKDDKLQGVGEHDDTVMASWLLDLAIRTIVRIIGQTPAERIATAEEFGIERVRIGDDY